MKRIITIVAVVLVVLGMYFYFTQNLTMPTQTGVALTEVQARVIAEKFCVKGGEVLEAGQYNAVTKTWWYDANLNATRRGCSPACVVSEETRTVEINWRCTGLLP